MQLMRIGQPGHEVPVVTDGERFFDASEQTALFGGDFGPEFWEHGLDVLRACFEAGTLAPFDAAGKRVGPPVAKPTAVVAIGLNYTDHAAEADLPVPEHLITFFKHPNTLCGPNDPVGLLPHAQRTDWEVEFAFVMGRRASFLSSPEEGREAIAGYALANDISEREYQNLTSQWGAGKNMPGSLPLGPTVVTADAFDPSAVRLRSWVNGEIRQDGTTADMVFDVGTIVYRLSQYMVLEAGDVVITGTPAGVALSGRFPFLKEGDVMELEGEGLGRQRQELFRIVR